MTEQSIKMECPVCKYKFSSVLTKEVLKEMVTHCSNCDVKINLEGINTTIGPAIRGYVPNEVINEHIAKMQDKDWKNEKGLYR